jgi:hypothetical protein
MVEGKWQYGYAKQQTVAQPVHSSKLSADDLAWIYHATVTAFDLVKNINRKTSEQIDGEIFTSLRRMSREAGGSQVVRGLFTGKMKTFAMRVQGRTATKEQEVLINMYNSLKRAKMSEEPDSMAELELALMAMQANLRRATEIANSAEGVRQGMDEIPKILEGEED